MNLSVLLECNNNIFATAVPIIDNLYIMLLTQGRIQSFLKGHQKFKERVCNAVLGAISIFIVKIPT